MFSFYNFFLIYFFSLGIYSSLFSQQTMENSAVLDTQNQIQDEKKQAESNNNPAKLENNSKTKNKAARNKESFYLNLKWNILLQEKFDNQFENIASLDASQNSFFLVSKNTKNQMVSVSYYEIDRDVDMETITFRQVPHLHIEGFPYYSIYYYYNSNGSIKYKEYHDAFNNIIVKYNFIYNPLNQLNSIELHKKDRSNTLTKIKDIKYIWENGNLNELKIYNGLGTQLENYTFKVSLNEEKLNNLFTPVQFPNGIGNYKLSVFILKSYNRFYRNKKVYSLVYEDQGDLIIPKKYNAYGILLNQLSPYKKENNSNPISPSPKQDTTQTTPINNASNLDAPKDLNNDILDQSQSPNNNLNASPNQ